MDIDLDNFGPVRSSGHVRAVSNNDRLVRFRLSDSTLDRVGTRIMPGGIDTEAYAANPIFLWAHDSGSMLGPPDIESVIGRSVEHGVTKVERNAEQGEAFDITVEFAPKSVNPKAETAFQLVKRGFLNATSIGFKPRAAERRSEQIEGRKRDVIVFTRSEMLEASLVPVPANPNALALARSLGYTDAEDAALALDEDVVKRWVRGVDLSGDAPKRHDDGEPGQSSLLDAVRAKYGEKSPAKALRDILKRAYSEG